MKYGIEAARESLDNIHLLHLTGSELKSGNHTNDSKSTHLTLETNRQRPMKGRPPSLHPEACNEEASRQVYKLTKKRPADFEKPPRLLREHLDKNTNGGEPKLSRITPANVCEASNKRMVNVKVWIQNKTRELSLRPRPISDSKPILHERTLHFCLRFCARYKNVRTRAFRNVDVAIAQNPVRPPATTLFKP